MIGLFAIVMVVIGGARSGEQRWSAFAVAAVWAMVYVGTEINRVCREIGKLGKRTEDLRPGICGAVSPGIVDGLLPVVCELQHGHAGWHEASPLLSGQPTRWSPR